MELFLNLLWLLVALGILGAWRVHWVRHGRGTRHQPVAEWTAIGSALILLFFAISLSDDLHQDVILFSESSASRRNSVIRISGPDAPDNGGVVAPPRAHFGLALLPRLAPRASLALISKVMPFHDGSVSRFQVRPFSGRAPPVCSL